MSDEDYSDYPDDPWCMHGYDPSDCKLVCGRCGHTCPQHPVGIAPLCAECECEGWIEPVLVSQTEEK